MHLIPYWMVWAKIECCFAQQKQFKPVQQNREQALTANIFESGPMPTPRKFGQLASHPKLLIGSELRLG